MLTKERETLKFLILLSKAIIIINRFRGGVEADLIVAENIDQCTCIKQMSSYMYHKTPEHTLKSNFRIFVVV